MTFRISKSSLSLAIAAFGSMHMMPVLAEASLEEIIVTAQKREESILDVPISIAVLGGEELAAARFSSVNDAIRTTPGVYSYDAFQGGGTKFSVRGVTSNSSLFSGSSTVGYYLDEIPFGFVKFPVTPDANAYDLERVEVLRGPQGTLYGANALNGVIRILTNDAELSEFDASFRASAAGTREGAPSYRGDLMVNIPLVEDKLAVRATVGLAELGGWIDQGTSGARDTNDADIENYRIKVNAAPTERLGVELMAWVTRDERGAANAGISDYTTLDFDPLPITTDTDAYGVTITYDFDSFTLLSATSYMEYDNASLMHLPPPPATVFGKLVTELYAELFSQEIRLNSNLESAWRWSLGAIYRDAEDRRVQPANVFFAHDYDGLELSESLALFGEVTRSLLDDTLDLTVGLRYFEDETGVREISRWQGTPPGKALDTDTNFDAVTPRLVATWHPGDEISIYGSYSQGFRSGFGQDASVINFAPFAEPVDPDKLTNYEIGAKGAVLDGRLVFDSAVYFIDWQDTQQRVYIDAAPPGAPPSGVITAVPVNGEDVSGWGADLGLRVAVTDHLNIGFNVSWNDLTFDNPVYVEDLVVFDEGDRLDESPETTAGASVSYHVGLTDGVNLLLSANAQYTSETLSRNALTGDYSEGDSILSTDLAAALEVSESVTTTLLVNNATDEGGIVRPFFGQPNVSSRMRPRTIGVQLDYRY